MADGRRRIVIVDDDVDFVAANRVALEAAGYEVLSANDSRRGVELVRQVRPDLVVMDLMMEQFYAGFSAVQALAGEEETRDIPILMVSGVTGETGLRVDEGGRTPEWLAVVEFIHKPVDPVELARMVAEVLARRE